MDNRVCLRGKRVLEVGCGFGDYSAILAKEYDCKVVGIDIVSRPTWADMHHPNLMLKVVDLSKEHGLEPESFDRIISQAVWEHVRHPCEMLKACHGLLRPDGLFYLHANLYRSAVASHLYRDVYFPWPHLLFPDHVFEAYYRRLGRKPLHPVWVNKLTYAHYLLYFKQIGFEVRREWFSFRLLDETFYRRFEDEH